ncbi:MAG: lipid A export permease/ATP-binding protein MsbA [Gammaproteobacteria bacterium]
MARPYDPSSARSIYQRLLRYALPYWKVFALSTLAMLVYSATETGFAALMKPLLDGSFVKKDPFIIKLIPPVMIGLFLVRGIADFLSTYGLRWIGRKVIGTLRGEMFHQLLHLPTAYYDSQSTGILISKLTYNVEQVSQAITNVVNLAVKDTFTVIGLMAWMIYLNTWLALLFLIAGPFIALFIVALSKRFRRISYNIQNSMGEVTQSVEEIISGQREIKTFGAQSYEERHFAVVNARNAHLNMKLAATNASSAPLMQLIAASVLAVVIYIATTPALLATITVGSFMSFMAAMLLLMPPLKRMTSINAILQTAIAAAESIFAMLDTPPELDTGTRPLARAKGSLVFQDVSFTYPAAHRPALEQISFEIPAGMTLAVVGRSGSGKSTLANLLPRFYDPSHGAILLDSVDLREYRLIDVREQMALVGQQVTLFNATIASNIAYGRLDPVPREAIERAAEAAYAMEFIRQLPNGLDTLVGENGVLLSGGQRQRIAIARALLKDAPILILDEATSALDTESERSIQAALEVLMRNRTTLVIAHRLSTVEKADRIVVMHQGRIVESGTHAELIALGKHYAALHSLQFREPETASE